jgi:hypothetical protein
MERLSTFAIMWRALTTGQQVMATLMFAAGFVCVGYMITAFFYVTRSDSRLRPGLTRDDVLDPDDNGRALVDEIYLTEAGRLDRRRAWRCVNRGTVAGAVMFAIYAIAQLTGYGL